MKPIELAVTFICLGTNRDQGLSKEGPLYILTYFSNTPEFVLRVQVLMRNVLQQTPCAQRGSRAYHGGTCELMDPDNKSQ